MPKYALAFEEHLDPIKKRGKVVLDGAIPEGASIQVIRKTPIETEFLAQALKPLPTEALEHALDKICYIQQEIEGHLCDCRGVDWPPPGVVGPPGEGEPPGGSDAPECQPYNCDAMVAYAVDAGYTVADFRDIQDNPIVPAEFSFESSGIDVIPQAGHVGNPMPIGGSIMYSRWLHADGGMDVCEDRTASLRLYDSALWLRTGAKLSLPAQSKGVAFAHHGIFNGVRAGGEGVILEKYWEVTDRASGDGVVGVGVWWSDTLGFLIKHQGGTIVLGKPVLGDMNYFACELAATSLRLDGGGPTYNPYVTIEAKVISNDTTYTLTFETQPSITSVYGGATVVESTGRCGMFTDMIVYLYALTFHTSFFDADELYTFYKQNFSSYEPPAYCQFSGAEI